MDFVSDSEDILNQIAVTNHKLRYICIDCASRCFNAVSIRKVVEVCTNLKKFRLIHGDAGDASFLWIKHSTNSTLLYNTPILNRAIDIGTSDEFESLMQNCGALERLELKRILDIDDNFAISIIRYHSYNLTKLKLCACDRTRFSCWNIIGKSSITKYGLQLILGECKQLVEFTVGWSRDITTLEFQDCFVDNILYDRNRLYVWFESCHSIIHDLAVQILYTNKKFSRTEGQFEHCTHADWQAVVREVNELEEIDNRGKERGELGCGSVKRSEIGYYDDGDILSEDWDTGSEEGF